MYTYDASMMMIRSKIINTPNECHSRSCTINALLYSLLQNPNVWRATSLPPSLSFSVISLFNKDRTCMEYLSMKKAEPKRHLQALQTHERVCIGCSSSILSSFTLTRQQQQKVRLIVLENPSTSCRLLLHFLSLFFLLAFRRRRSGRRESGRRESGRRKNF